MSQERKRKNMESKYKDHTGSYTSSIPRWTNMGNENDGYDGFKYMDPWGQMGLKYAPQYYHNEPGRKHTRSSEISSSSCDTDSNVQNEKPIKGRLQGRKIALIVIVVGLVAIAAAITVILVLTLKPAESQPNKFRVVTVSLSVAETFKPMYNDPSSSEYKLFAGNFTNAMDEIFQANNTKGYKGIQIVELKNGSVIVIFTLVIEFKQSEGPPREEFLKAVITGHKTYENDSNSVVVKNVKFWKASVFVVKTEEFVSNPISTTAEPVTKSTTATKATTATNTISPPSPGPNNFSVATINLAVDETFKPEYNNTGSVEYKSFVADFAKAMDKIFNTTEGYKGIQIKELKNGSVIVIFIIVIEVKQNAKPLGEQELMAVINGQQKDANDTTIVVIERFRIPSISVVVVSIDKVIANPLWPTTDSTTTKTSTSATTFQPATSTTVQVNTTTSTTYTSNLQPNTSTTTSTIAVVTTPTTSSATLEPSTTSILTSTSTATSTSIRTSPETSEPKATSTTILTSATTSIPATTTPASSNNLESNMTNVTPLTSSTSSMSTTTVPTTQTSLVPSTIDTSTSTSTTTLTWTTANTTLPNTPKLEVNSTTVFLSTSTPMPTTTSTTSSKTLEQSSTTTTSTPPPTPASATASSTSLKTPEPNLTNTIMSTSSTISTPTTISTSLTKAQEHTTTTTTSPTTSITKANTTLTTLPKLPELSTTSFNPGTISTTLSNTPASILTNTTTITTTTASSETTPSVSSTKLSEPSTTSTTTPNTTTSLKSITISTTSPKSPESTTTTSISSTSTATSHILTNSTATPNMTSTTTSTTMLSLKPTTNSTTLPNISTTIMTNMTTPTSTTASNGTSSISSTKSSGPSINSTTTLTSTTSFRPTTINNTSQFPEPYTTTATKSISPTTSNITTYTTTSPKLTEANMTSTTTLTTPFYLRSTTNSSTLSGAPTPNMTATTALKSTAAANITTSSISSTKSPEPNTTITTAPTSTTSLIPSTISTITPKSPEPNTTIATTSTLGTSSIITTYSTTSLKSTVVDMTSTTTSNPTNTLNPTTTNIVLTKITEMSSTIASTSTSATTLKQTTTSVFLSVTPDPNATNATTSTSEYTTKPSSSDRTTMATTNISAISTVLANSTMGLSTISSTTIVTTTTTTTGLPEKPTIKLPDIMIQDGYSDVIYPFVCEGKVEDTGGMLIAEVNKNGTFFLYKAFGESRYNNNTEYGLMQIYIFYVEGRFTQDWDNAKIRCASINNMTGVESGNRQISEEKIIRLLPADICTGVASGSNVSHPYSGCDLYLICQANKPSLGKCPEGKCYFDNVRACRKLECPFVHCNDTEVTIGKSASIACDVFFCGASFSLSVNHSQETLFREMNISNQILRTVGNLTVHIVIRNGSALVNLSFLETKCNDSGEYVIDLNRGSFTDRAYLTLKVPNKIPTLTLSQSIVGCTESTIYCTGELGIPQESIYLEVNFRGGSFTKYNQTSLRLDKKECSNTGYLEMKFIAGDKWNGAQVRCITGNKTETRMESNVQLINISSSGVCFSPDEYIAYMNATVQLNCTVTGLSAGDIVTFSRVTTANDTEKILSTAELGKVPSYNVSGIYIRAVPLLANDFVFVLTIVSVSCGDRGTYFCKVGNSQASARLRILQKPGTPILTMSRLIFEKQYMQPEYPLVCEGEVGYPSGKMMVEVNTNGSYTKYSYYEISSVVRVSDSECSTYQTLKFSIPGLVSMTLNNTLIRCVATNDITLTSNESPPTSLLQRIYVVQDSFCSNLNNGNYLHPYECTMYIFCTNRLVTPQTCGNQCANTTGIGSIACLNCSIVRCKDQEGFILTTTAATTTEKPTCPFVRCENIQARLNTSATIRCQLLFCGESLRLSLVSIGININNRVNDTFSTTQNNVKVLVYANKGAATLNMTFDPVECISAGTYNISIDDGSAFDLPSLEVIVYPETPTFIIPTDMYENQKTTATCTAQLGDPPAMLYLERMAIGGQYARFEESFPVNISKGNCSNIGHLDADFYPNSAWNGSKLRCVAERPDIEQRFRSDEKVTLIKSPKLYFTKTSYSEFVGSSTRLTCVAKEMSSADFHTIVIQRSVSSGSNELLASVFINGTIKNVFVNVTISNESSINSSSATVHIDFHYLSCSDIGIYYCIAGEVSARGTMDILRKPGIPTFNMSKYIYENKYMLPEHPMVCEGEVGYPSGKMTVEAYINGSFIEYHYYEISRQIRVSEDTCSTHEILQFSVPGLVPLALNNTAMRCVATNNITSTSDESPHTSQLKRLYVVPASFCNGSKTGDFKHPYECTFYITCATGILTPRNCLDKCANITSSGTYCLDCSQVTCINPGLIVETTTAITTTTKVICPAVQCVDAYARLNGSTFIECRIKYCGSTFDFAILSENFQLQNSTSGNFSRLERNVQVKIYADSGDATLSIIVDPVKCINAGMYNVSIASGVAFGLATLHVQVIHERPTLVIPSDIYENQRAAIYCIAQLGDPPGSLQIEISSSGKPAITFDYLINITKGNCSNIGRVDVELYPNSPLNGSNITCRANGPNNQGLPLLDEKTILIKSPKIYFANVSNSGFIGSSARLTCQIKEMSSTDLQTVIITRDSTPGATEFVSSFSINRTIVGAFQNISISSESLISSSGATIHVDFYNLRCTDERNYYCTAGTFSAKGALQIFRKPKILDFRFPTGILENANTLPFNCTAEKGYPAGRVAIEINKNGNFVEAPFILNRNNVTSDGCSNIEIVTFIYSFTTTWNRTDIRCKAENERTLGPNEAPPSVTKPLLILPADICQASNYLYIPHPYECHKFIQCGTQAYVTDCPFGTCRFTVPSNETYCFATCNNCTDYWT